MKISKKSRNLIFSAALLLLIVTIAAGFFSFKQSIHNLVRKNCNQNIIQLNQLYSELLKNKLEDQIQILKTQAVYFEDADLSSEAFIKRTVLNCKLCGSFKMISAVSSDGTSTSYLGKNLPNVGMKTAFKNALKTGNASISDRIEMDEKLQPVMTFMYPVKGKNDSTAVLSGTLDYNVIKSLFSVPVFDGLGFSYVISGSGNVILSTKDSSRNLSNVDFFTLVKDDFDGDEISEFKTDIKENRSGIKYSDSGENVFVYSPLGINDWFIVTEIPLSYISNQELQIRLRVYILLFVIIITLIFFCLIIYFIYKEFIHIEKDNERLIIATNQTQSVVFEYDLEKKTAAFSGDIKFILGSEKPEHSFDLIKTEYFSRVHPDDKKEMIHLHKAVEEGVDEYISEFRYRCFDNKYYWLRMTGSVLKSASGKYLKFMGTVSNVNAEVTHFQELRAIAETDTLSGLLNKGAMNKKIRKLLETASPEAKFAMFMLDLDNFKQVNDQLGHSIGDLAIKDVAKKLSLIFTDKDYLSRFGGDEFCVLLCMDENVGEGLERKLITDKAKKLNRILKEEYFDETKSVQVSASVGISLYPDNGKSYEELFDAADKALYYTKQHGKNGYKIFGDIKE